MLSDYVLPFCTSRSFVHDHFPVHSALTDKNLLSSNGINVVKDWPRKSGDIMPMETVWREIVTKLSSSGKLVFNAND